MYIKSNHLLVLLKVSAISLCAILLFYAGELSAASFDCSKASNKVERTICSVASISALDEKLAVAYKKAGCSYKQSQRDWLKKRNKCGADANCLFIEYTARIKFLTTASSNPPIRTKRLVASNLADCAPNVFHNCYGTYTWDTGEKYVGEWQNRMRDGEGVFTYRNDDKYTGSWKGNVPNGDGKLLTKDGVVYVGQWIDGNYQKPKKAQNIIDISELVMAETAGFPYKFADYYVNNLDNIRKDTLCDLDLYVRRGIDYCFGFLSIYTQSLGKDNVSLDLQNAVSELSKDNFAKEFKLARDSYCRIPQSKSTFENGVEDYPTKEKFGKNAKMVADGYLAECGPDIEALSTIVGEARLLNETDIPQIFEKVNVAFEANPIFIPGKIGFDEGFYWLDDQKLTSSMALEIPAGIRAGEIKRWSGIGFWGYIDDYTDEGNRIFAKLCTSSQQPCPQPVSAIFAGQPNPAFPNAALEFMSKARSFLKRSMSNKRTVQLNGFTSVFSNTGGFYIDVQNWTILR